MMMKTRKIHKMYKSKPTLEGAGVHLHRAFGGSNDARTFDPFLLLDDFRNDRPQDYAPGFPWHPHRGIETITYVLRGQVAHGDSMGNHGAITSGDVQWMTAGSGILHQEMPEGDSDFVPASPSGTTASAICRSFARASPSTASISTPCSAAGAGCSCTRI
jgi:redox-sensitive bicupin YhaK (pirin superfamily)